MTRRERAEIETSAGRREGGLRRKGAGWRSTVVVGTMALGVLAVSCGRPPRPPELAHAEQVSKSPAMLDAAKLAPQAVAHAEQLRQAADKAYQEGQIATADILAERAVAAYERVTVLARAARASEQERAAKAELAASEATLRDLDAEQARVNADTAALENLIHVIRDAQPVVRSGHTTADREQARFEAARSIAADARLLCVAASLLGKPVEGLADAQAEVTKLEETLGKHPRPVPIDEALRVRARCLSLLTLERRSQGNPGADADVVLTELSAAKQLDPRRDDRGVVVTLRPDVTGSDSRTRQAIAPVAKVAAAHPEFPLLIVAHTSTRPSAADVDRAQAAADRVVKALEAAGIASTRVRTEMARGALPVLPEPIPPPRPSQNERVEVILVSPNG